MTADDPLSALCRRCGLCCDGSLFSLVPLADDEPAAARRRGLPIALRDGAAPALRQPCPALVARACTVYDERPAACRRYRCLLYAALADHEVSPAEAAATVDDAHAAIAAALAGRPSLPAARAAARAGDLSPETEAALARAEALLARRFGRPRP